MKNLKSINFEKFIDRAITIVALLILFCLFSELLFNYAVLPDEVAKIVILTQIVLLVSYNVVARNKVKRLTKYKEVGDDALKMTITTFKIINGALSREARARREFQVECSLLKIQNEALQQKNKSLLSQIAVQKEDLQDLRETLKKVPVDCLSAKFSEPKKGSVIIENLPVEEKITKTRKPRAKKQNDENN